MPYHLHVFFKPRQTYLPKSPWYGLQQDVICHFLHRQQPTLLFLFQPTFTTNTSNDRHANQEVAYLLQRIEDFPGTVILATNLRSNIDEAFSRRFQSVIYFPMPDRELRTELWQKMLPKKWLGKQREELLSAAAETELSGGSITNVVRRCALYLTATGKKTLDKQTLEDALRKEEMKM